MTPEEKEKIIRENADHIAIINDELGGVQKELGSVKDILTSHKVSLTKLETNVSWLKDQSSKIDNRTWIILSTIILGFAIQIAFRFLF